MNGWDNTRPPELGEWDDDWEDHNPYLIFKLLCMVVVTAVVTALICMFCTENGNG